MERLAKGFSFLTHPLLGPMYGLILLTVLGIFPHLPKSNATLITFFAMVFVNTFLIPFLTALLLQKMGKVDTIYMRNRDQRGIPYFVTGLFFFFTFYFAQTLGISPEFAAFMQAASLAVLGSLLINMKWKISAHMVGMGGLLGLVFSLHYYYDYVGFWLVIAAAVLAGLVGSARLILKAHESNDIYLGFLLGFLSQLVVFNLI